MASGHSLAMLLYKRTFLVPGDRGHVEERPTFQAITILNVRYCMTVVS